MIEFNNWQIWADPRLCLQQNDHLSRELTVSGPLPEGWEWSMLVQVDGQMDIWPLHPRQGGGVSVLLTAQQLGPGGFYRMQLRGTQGEVTRHTNVITLFVPRSLCGGKQWPVLPTEFSDLEQRVRDYSSHPPIVNPSGYWQLWDGTTYVDSTMPATGGVLRVAYNADAWCWQAHYLDGHIDSFPGPSPMEAGKFTYLREDFNAFPAGEDAFFGSTRYTFNPQHHVNEDGVRFARYDVIGDEDKLLKLTCTNHVIDPKLYNKFYIAAPVVGGCTMEAEFLLEQPDYEKGRPGIHLDLFGTYWFGGVEADNRIIRLAIRAKDYVRITDTTTGQTINTWLTDHTGARFAPKCGVWYVMRHSCESGKVSLALWERDSSGPEQAYTLEYRTNSLNEAALSTPRYLSVQTCNGADDGVTDVPYTALVSQIKVWHDLTGPSGKDGTPGAVGQPGAAGVGVRNWQYNPDTWRWEMRYTDGRVDTFPGMSLTERGKFTIHRDNFNRYPVGTDTFYNNGCYQFSAANHGAPNSSSYAIYNIIRDGNQQALELVCENATTHYFRTLHTVSGPYTISMDFKLETTVAGSRPGFILCPVAGCTLVGKVIVVLRAGDYARIRDTSVSGVTEDQYILNDSGAKWKPEEGVWYHMELRCELGRICLQIRERDNAAAPVRTVEADVAALDEAMLTLPKTLTLQTYAPGSDSQPVVGGIHTMQMHELRVWQDMGTALSEADRADIVSRVLAALPSTNKEESHD